MKLTRTGVWLIVACLTLGACDHDDSAVGATTASGAAANGLIAYSHGGDIYLGDPMTGATTLLVGGPESDINPIFSPDGTRIAFVRGRPVEGPGSLRVVRVDGLDEHEVVATTPGAGIPRGAGPFAWTPDGLGIVAQGDLPPYTGWHDGELALFDASGVDEPRLLVPPLNPSIGAIYFNPSAQVAPMFRPPDGDLILNPNGDALEVFDADLTLVRQFNADSIVRYDSATWSPDGSAIAVSVSRLDPDTEQWRFDTLVLDGASGEVLHSFGWALHVVWSPDGAAIAYEAWDLENPPDEARIAVYDLASGTTRILESSASSLKSGAVVETITSNKDHDWFYEGWSWSPTVEASCSSRTISPDPC